MNQESNDLLFDALLGVAITKAFEMEMDEFPSQDDLSEDYRPSQELNDRVLRLVEKKRRPPMRWLLSKKTHKIAAIIIVISTVTPGILFSVSATRNAILNVFSTSKDDYTEIDDHGSQSHQIIIRPNYLPEGYSEISTESSGASILLVFANNNGMEIDLYQRPAAADAMLIDNDDTDSTIITIDACSVYVIKAQTDTDSNILIWENNNTVFEINAQIDYYELVRIAESMIKSS